MLYCELCGAANDILSRQCHRCGGTLSQEDSVLAPAARTLTADYAAGESGQTDANQSPGTNEIGQGLDLPDWLKRAASQTPPGASEAPQWSAPPAGFHVASAESDRPGAERVASPLPPVPTADLPEAMPDWLKAPPASAAAAPTVEPTTDSALQSGPDPDALNTTSFIAESDLPEWIRQIAAADAAKQAEAERMAVEAALRTEGEARARVVLPGEEPAPAAVANPWLSRREGTGSTGAWSETAPKTTVPAPEIQPNVASLSTPPDQEVVAIEDARVPASSPRPRLRLPELSVRAGTGSGSRSRLYLLAAGALLLMLLLLLLL